ncbi:Profilin/allergen [Jaminaea rosea]|uniref:Profilin n=1 Tax=Jaminaea rosea TaxID=1569628 RepID=A0A316UY72_9BASI|nr:Profilin/allergen [Jaminaea rosea]PWN30162.1 Profilin/allergen [Jaminaea rosea]
MSWQGYIDNQLVGTKSITQAAILGIKGGVWAASPGFTVTPQEQTALVKGFDDPSPLQSGGLHVAGKKYFCLQANDRSIYGKAGADGVVLVKTNQAVLVGQYASPILPGEATKVVEQLGDYLLGVGY